MSAIQLFETLVSLNLQACVLVAVAHLLARFTQNDPMRCRIWQACHVLLLLLVAIALTLPHIRLFNPWAHLSNAAAIQVATAQNSVAIAALGVWLLGATASTLLFLAGWWQVHRILQTCEEVDDDELQQAFDETREVCCSKSVPRLLCSPLLASPFCWQIHRPAIVIPQFLLEFPRREIRLIVRHEIEHLRASHPLALFVQRIVETVFWFHPMVWWSSQQATLTREFACDAASVDDQSEVDMYLRVLLKVVERQVASRDLPSIDLAFGRSKAQVTRRAIRLTALASRRECVRNSGSFLSIALAITALLTTFVWLPVNVLASSRDSMSPWPVWTSWVLHSVAIHARDYEPFATRTRLRELAEETAESVPQHPRNY